MSYDIRTSPTGVPIPNSSFNYCAWVDGEEERHGTGHGASEAEAAGNLLQQIYDRDPERFNREMGIPDNDCPQCGSLLLPGGGCFRCAPRANARPQQATACNEKSHNKKAKEKGNEPQYGN
jgi:hypothetical protein